MLLPALGAGASGVPAEFFGEASQGLARTAGDQPRRHRQHQVQWQAETLQLPTVAVLAGALAEPFRGQPGEALGVAPASLR